VEAIGQAGLDAFLVGCGAISVADQNVSRVRWATLKDAACWAHGPKFHAQSAPNL
jgi:hypothetical protein